MRILIILCFLTYALSFKIFIAHTKQSRQKSEVKKCKQSHIDRRIYRRILQEIKDNSALINDIMNAEDEAMIRINDLLSENF